MFDLPKECLQQRQIEYRLGDRVFRPSSHFVLEAPDFFVEVWDAGIGAHSDYKACAYPNGIAAYVQSAVQILYDVYQTNGIHVEDCRRVWIVAHLRRITRDANQITNTGRGCAQQVGL